MSHWSQDAQSGGSKGMGNNKAGDPVLPCVEGVKLEPLTDYDEAVLLHPRVDHDPLPLFEPSMIMPDPLPALDHQLAVFETPSLPTHALTISPKKVKS